MKRSCLIITLSLLLSSAFSGEKAGSSQTDANKKSVGVMPKQTTIELTNGISITGTVIMSGPKGTMLLTENGDIFIPKDKIKPAEKQEKAEKTSELSGADIDVVDNYMLNIKEGQYTVGEKTDAVIRSGKEPAKESKSEDKERGEIQKDKGPQPKDDGFDRLPGANGKAGKEAPQRKPEGKKGADRAPDKLKMNELKKLL